MTFKDKYSSESTWHGKVMVMEIYHLAMCQRERQWTVGKTAEYFECSIGLVSENLRLASALHIDAMIWECVTRQEALKKLNNGKGVTNGTL